RSKIARAFQQALKNVRVETHHGARNVEITKIYIPPRLRIRESEHSKQTVKAALSGMDEKSAGGPVPGELFGASTGTKRDVLLFRYLEFKHGFKRAVVLGDPGGGKSTLCQRVCYDLAKDSALVLQYGSRPQISGQDQ